VKYLQMFLNDIGFIVAMTGPGSKGQETMYFGNATRVALIRFQEFFKTEILAPYNLLKGTGNFGPATMRKVNGMLGR
jgi:hypothetical protein